MLKDVGEQDFFNFLGVDDAFLDVEPPSAKVTGKKPTGNKPSGKKARKKPSGKKGSGMKGSGKGSGKVSGKGNVEASGEGSADPSEFSRKNLVRAANTLAKSLKEKRGYLLSL
jgi:hypothetical protein